MNKIRPPRRLYKYRAFNANTLRLLNQGKIYYANPAGFNDPLDCRPIITVDSDLRTLEKLCYRMLVLDRGKEAAVACIQNYRYMSRQYGDYKIDSEAVCCYAEYLRGGIRDLVYSEMREHGVVSLAKRWNCPLMWSHYADEHRGLCIEYDTKDHHCNSLLPVKYNAAGTIRTSDLWRWKIEKSADAESVVRDIFFYTKAREWSYEREWRDVGNKIGERESTLNSISAVYFGLRCDVAVSTTVVMLFSNASTRIGFFKLYQDDNSFRLKRSPIDVEEVKACGYHTPISWDFENLNDTSAKEKEMSAPR